jgi:riboflavin synthase
MFTGLVEHVGAVQGVTPQGAGKRLTLALGPLADGTRVGDSICINGVCLTVTELKGAAASFDAVAETLRRSNLGTLRTGDAVNLERALAVGDRLGGHFVQGHVDAAGRVARIATAALANEIHIAVDADIAAQMIPKGSIAIDGVSLTIAELQPAAFSVAVIPHTWQATTLSRRKVGDRVNLELDMIGKYVQRLLRHGRDSGGGDLRSMLEQM